MRAAVCSILLASLLVACPPSEKKAPAQQAPCARVGQTCEVSAGKLGTCVMKDGCVDPQPSCFVCQSQH